MRKIVILLSLLLLAAGCDKYDGYNKDDLKYGTIGLKVKGKTVFQYDSSSCQLACNKGKREFRAGTDNMSDYFIVTLSAIPEEEGQTLTGNITWTTIDDTVSMTGLNIKVMQIGSDGTLWLWCAKQKIAAVVKILY